MATLQTVAKHGLSAMTLDLFVMTMGLLIGLVFLIAYCVWLLKSLWRPKTSIHRIKYSLGRFPAGVLVVTMALSGVIAYLRLLMDQPDVDPLISAVVILIPGLCTIYAVIREGSRARLSACSSPSRFLRS